jgi:hypothetical protein
VTEIVLDPKTLQPRTPEILSPTTKPQTAHSMLVSPSSSSSSVTAPPIIQGIVLPPPPIMAARYAPLVLAAPLHSMPQDYQMRFPQFDGTGPLSAQQHVDKMNDYFDLQEVDEDDVQMRFFAQSLTGDVKKWYKGLRAASVLDLTAFQRIFLDRWEVKKNPLQILSEYENIRRNQGETVQDYYTRFNNLYNAILADIKPPQGLALIKFPDGFNADMSYQLRERNSTTLEDMQKSAISVEANLLAKRAWQRTERRVTIKEPSTSSSDAKLDSLDRAMESVRTLKCTFLPTLFATITPLLHSHLNSHYHFTLSFQRYTTSLIFTICLICFAYNFTLLSYLTIDKKGISAETVRTAD